MKRSSLKIILSAKLLSMPNCLEIAVNAQLRGTAYTKKKSGRSDYPQSVPPRITQQARLHFVSAPTMQGGKLPIQHSANFKIK